jgi:hypothetical protein
MSLYNCKFCNKEFKNKYTLKNHIDNAKYCINKRNKYEKQLEEIKNKYEKQIEEVKNKYEKQLEEQENKYEKQIYDLQNKLENIALKAVSKPTNIHNNNQKINQIINNLTPITDNHLKDQAKFLTLEHIKNGASGYAQYALEYPLKDKIVCTDFARKKIKFKDNEGNLIDDPEMAKLLQKLCKAILEQNQILIDEYMDELQSKFIKWAKEPNNEMNEDETEEYSTIGSIITDAISQIRTQNREIKEIADGYKPDIFNEIVRYICSKLVVN